LRKKRAHLSGNRVGLFPLSLPPSLVPTLERGQKQCGADSPSLLAGCSQRRKAQDCGRSKCPHGIRH
jgi:hypothetical protein